MRTLARIVIAGAVMASGTVLATAPAHAASCSGSVVGRYPLNYGTTKIGELQIYYNSTTGDNCALMRHVGPTYGVSSNTNVRLDRCTQTASSPYCNSTASVGDSGNYAYYAGPVRLRARGHCIWADGGIYYKGAKRYVTTGGSRHCG